MSRLNIFFTIFVMLLITNNFCYGQEINEVYLIFKINTENSIEKNSYYFKSKFYISGESFKIKRIVVLNLYLKKK